MKTNMPSSCKIAGRGLLPSSILLRLLHLFRNGPAPPLRTVLTSRVPTGSVQFVECFR